MQGCASLRACEHTRGNDHLSLPQATTASKCISLSSTDKLEVLVGKLSRAWRLQHGNTVFVHRGNVIHDASTVASVCLASGATVFAVDAKWWAFKRRERARRGLLTSTKFVACPRCTSERLHSTRELTPVPTAGLRKVR